MLNEFQKALNEFQKVLFVIQILSFVIQEKRNAIQKQILFKINRTHILSLLCMFETAF